MRRNGVPDERRFCARWGWLVRNHPLDLGYVGLVKHHVSIELALALGSFGSQDVALVRVSALDFACTCLLEAFGRSAMSLQLWHSVFLLQHKRANAASDRGYYRDSAATVKRGSSRMNTDQNKIKKEIPLDP